jgi:hypothetical protein
MWKRGVWFSLHITYVGGSKEGERKQKVIPGLSGL